MISEWRVKRAVKEWNDWLEYIKEEDEVVYTTGKDNAK